MADIGELVVRIKADAAQLEREMRKAQGTVQQSAGSMSGAVKELKSQLAALVPALTAAAVVTFGRTALAEADHINDLAMRVGFLGSTLSALDIPLRQSGSSLDEFAGTMVRMNNVIGEAVKGGQEQVKTFDALGLSVRKLEQLTPEEQFYAIAEALAQVESQSEFTNLGISIFGRSFASIAPMIRESNGELAKFVEKQKDLGNALTDEELRRIDEWGDRWTYAIAKMKLGLIDFLDYFYKLGQEHRRMLEDMDLPAGVSHSPGKVLSNDEAARRVRDSLKAKGIEVPGVGAKGSNAGLIKDTKTDSARKSLQDYNRELERQNEILRLTPREQAAVEAKYKTLDLAQKAGVKNSEQMVRANMELARTNYDLKESMQEAARFQQELHDKLASSLTDIAFSFDSAAESAKNFALAIAKAAFERRVAGPLADSLIGTGGNPGLLDGLLSSAGNIFGGFFADGGSPPVGKASIVGERGPEIFVPRSAGTIIPNGGIGGTQVVVHQTINMSPGLPETVNAALARSMPGFMAATQSAVFQAIERGGSEAKLVGKRS